MTSYSVPGDTVPLTLTVPRVPTPLKVAPLFFLPSAFFGLEPVLALFDEVGACQCQRRNNVGQ